ncbi:MAG TPA: hypothetical protein PKH06_02215 [Candidatus Dojkabacteria bacterium]|nr:hypothetical protein [Candidatus Dojkabacteria bacterium]
MLEKIHSFVLQNSITSIIYSPVYNFINKQLSKLEEILSDKTYESIISMLDKISSIAVILLGIYIVYSTLLFIYSLLFKKKFRIMLLISLAISIVFFLAFLTVYSYININ